MKSKGKGMGRGDCGEAARITPNSQMKLLWNAGERRQWNGRSSVREGEVVHGFLDGVRISGFCVLDFVFW